VGCAAADITSELIVTAPIIIAAVTAVRPNIPILFSIDRMLFLNILKDLSI
jgi:hypothetical protein